MSMVIELGKLPLLFDETQGTLALPPVTDEQFYEFCQRNPLISAERTAKGSLHLMPPAEAWADSRGSLLIFDIEKWNSALTKPGITFGASAGFLLPNGAIRAPDASWVSQARWDALPADKRTPYPHLCPDFVVEVMSPSDRVGEAKAKMEEYRDSGARLGWLVDRKSRAVLVYRPSVPVQTLTDPASVSGEPELPGFIADLSRVFA